MKVREAKRWLRAQPKGRQAAMMVDGEMVTRWVPYLCGREITLPGAPPSFDTEAAAVALARDFQKQIRANHPDAVE